jgi:PAS domain S-box-containing protein
VLRLVAQHGFEQEFRDVFRDVSPDDLGAAGRALRSQQRVIVEDVETDELYTPLRAVASAAGYRAVQLTPILSRAGDPLGMISTHWRAPHRPSERSLRLLDLYVRQAAEFIDRCRVEQALRASEQRLKALSDMAPGTMLWATEPDGACSFVTRGWQDYTGHAADRAFGFGWLELVHDEDRERTRRAFMAATRTREACFLDYRLRHADGEFRWVRAAGRPRYDDGGSFLGFVGSINDIHERKLTADALRDSEAILAGQKEAFQAVMGGQPLAVCLHALVRTAIGHYADARAAFYMFGDDASEGLRHVTGMSDAYAREVDGFKVGSESVACGVAMHKGEPVITPDVEEDPLWEPWRSVARAHHYRGCWSFPVRAAGGPVLGTFALYFPTPRTPAPEDLKFAAAVTHAAAIVSSRYKEAAERARAEQALKEASRRKDEFLAVLGHELRNPLAPLSLATDLLQDAELRPDVTKNVLPMMRRQLDHLARLVDDLLDVTRITRGHAELRYAPFDLRAAVESAVEQSRPLIEERRHTLHVELGDAPLRADGDLQRLTQVFGNLLSNAAKYAEPGGVITVRATVDADEAVISVADKGFGIPKERVAHLFKMFSQVPEHRSLVGGGGLGVGLALCRQLVELHGGSIEARSEGLGRGSEFVVRLPLAGAAREYARAAARSAIDSARRRVLVVDDNADAAVMLQMALEALGHEARAVHDGPAALAALADFAADVVLLDLGMPHMDGFEVARRIRAMPGGGDVLLVALTGWGQDEDRRRTAEAGFDEHVTKPVGAARLAAMLAPESGDPPAGSTRVGPTRIGAVDAPEATARRRRR